MTMTASDWDEAGNMTVCEDCHGTGLLEPGHSRQHGAYKRHCPACSGNGSFPGCVCSGGFVQVLV